MVKDFACNFSGLLDLIIIDSETKTKQGLEKRRGVPR
jgi:hypothetical protein